MMNVKTDKVGMLVSVGCIIHCLLTPILIPILPAAGFIFSHSPFVHGVLVAVIATIALLAFIPGYKKHRNNVPGLLAFIGVGIITCMGALELFSEITGNEYEAVPITSVTILGSLIIVYAHYLNHRYICACKHHGKHSCH